MKETVFAKNIRLNNMCVSDLESLMKKIKNQKDYPHELVAMLANTIAEFKSYNMEIFKEPVKDLEQLQGNVLSKDDVLGVVVEASGYNKWTIVEAQNSSEENEKLKQELEDDGLTCEAQLIKEYQVSRKTRGKDEVGFIIIHCFPGHTKVQVQTSHVGYFINDGDLIKNKELEGEISLAVD